MKNNRGEITIIMVITVIVLIILGGICIFMLTGENGIFVPRRDIEITNNTDGTQDVTNNTLNTNETQDTNNNTANQNETQNMTNNAENQNVTNNVNGALTVPVQ